MPTVFDVAEYILELIAPKDGSPRVTTWKLQKLVYYSQAWSMVWERERLFPERIEAWANGPVCPALYERHRGKYQVRQTDIERKPAPLADEQQLTVQAVVEGYGELSGAELRDRTHHERPWKDARKGLKSGKRGTAEITPESMRKFYERF